MTVFNHIGSSSLEETVELAKHSQKLGCHGCTMVPPTYFKPRTEE